MASTEKESTVIGLSHALGVAELTKKKLNLHKILALNIQQKSGISHTNLSKVWCVKDKNHIYESFQVK